MRKTTIPPRPLRIEYPENNDKPLGETDAHRREILAIIEMLELYFAAHADVYISGSLLFYYEKGNPRAVVSPDVFVVKGVPKHERRIYKLWEERQPPAIVFEITSRTTRREDQRFKRNLFTMLGVREYFFFDPLSEYLKPPFQGFRLAGAAYVAIKPDAEGALTSEELGLRMLRDGSYLRLIDVATGQPLLRAAELDAARRAAEEQARSESDARRAAEAEIDRLRAEIARLRGQS